MSGSMLANHDQLRTGEDIELNARDIEDRREKSPQRQLEQEESDSEPRRDPEKAPQHRGQKPPLYQLDRREEMQLS
jgi:hypothetical protein